MTMTAQEWRESLGHEERAMLETGKRCGVRWVPFMPDWFISWSPRNENDHAEGPWDHWVDLALAILSDPLTEHVRPVLMGPDMRHRRQNFDAGTNRRLSDEELRARFEEVST